MEAREGHKSPRQSPQQERNNERREHNPARQALTSFSLIASLLKPLDDFSAPLSQQLIELGFPRRKLARSHSIGQHVFAEYLKLNSQLGRYVCTAHLPPHRTAPQCELG